MQPSSSIAGVSPAAISSYSQVPSREHRHRWQVASYVSLASSQTEPIFCFLSIFAVNELENVQSINPEENPTCVIPSPMTEL